MSDLILSELLVYLKAFGWIAGSLGFVYLLAYYMRLGYLKAEKRFCDKHGKINVYQRHVYYEKTDT